MTPSFHIGLHVSNIKNTVDFYSRFLDATPVKVRDDYAKFELEHPSLILTFNQSPQEVANQFGHLGIKVYSDEELHQLKDRTIQAGLSIKEEIGTSCCYAKQNKFWVLDPDGYEWEVFHFIEDVEVNDPEQNVCCSS